MIYYTGVKTDCYSQRGITETIGFALGSFLFKEVNQVFNFLKKDINLYSPVTGKCFEIETCEDETFSSKVLGDGYYILPTENVVCSPCNGKIQSIFPTKHAVGITKEDGTEVMVHIGVDTVKLDSSMFTSFVKVGDKVKPGTPLIKFDDRYLYDKSINMSIIVVMINSQNSSNAYTKEKSNKSVRTGDRIISYGTN